METLGTAMANMVKRELASAELNKTLKEVFAKLQPNQVLVITTKSGTEYGLVRGTDNGNMLGRKTNGKTSWHKLGVWSVAAGNILKTEPWITTRIMSWEVKPYKGSKVQRKMIPVAKFQAPVI